MCLGEISDQPPDATYQCWLGRLWLYQRRVPREPALIIGGGGLIASPLGSLTFGPDSENFAFEGEGGPG